MSTDRLAELTPYNWSAAEHTRARVALQCAIQGNFGRMEEHLRSLPLAALVDLRYALDVMHPMVRLLTMTREKVLVERAERSLTPQEHKATAFDESERLPVRCPRCGHDEHVHEDEEPGAARCCLDCGGFCHAVVLVPAGVEGWAIEGRAGK